MSLEKIKELKHKAEVSKALADLAESEAEKKYYLKLLNNAKKELAKIADIEIFNAEKSQQNISENSARDLNYILADNETNLTEIAENASHLFGEK